MSNDGGGFGGLNLSVADVQSRMAVQQGNELQLRADDNSIEAARKFESYLAQVMLREMRKTLPEGGIFSGPPMDSFVDMFDKAVADRIAEGGRLGLANQIARSLGTAAAGMEGALPGLPPVSQVAGRLIPFRQEAGEEHHHGIERNRRLGIWPVVGAVSSKFGHRADPFTGKGRHHAGLDIAAAAGTPIRAVESGEVIVAGRRPGYGNVVMVRHEDGSTALYAHCRDLSVQTGSTIGAGETLGTVGDTGRATGPHLHLELRENGVAVDPQTVYQWHGE